MKRRILEVKTWLNSGNVVFSCEEADAAALADRIERMMQCEFGLDIPVFVILQEELADILRHAPDWWGTENQEIYDNLVFLLPPVTFQEVYHEIGAPKEGLEQIQEYRSAVFWSFSRKEYQKTNWWPKTARRGYWLEADNQNREYRPENRLYVNASCRRSARCLDVLSFLPFGIMRSYPGFCRRKQLEYNPGLTHRRRAGHPASQQAHE